MGDELDKLMVDKVERTQRFKELEKEITSNQNEILELIKRDNKILKILPKPSTDYLEKLENEKEVLRKLLRENKKKQEEEKKEISKERRFLLSNNQERITLKNKRLELEDERDKLFKEQRNEMKKDMIWKEGKKYSVKEWEKYQKNDGD